MKPLIIYCYDAYCVWCYGFSEVIKKLSITFNNNFDFDVLSGGMMIDENKMPIEKIAPFILASYKRVEKLTRIKFGEDFLWHINNPDKSDWVMNSEKPAIALCIFNEIYPDKQIEFATGLEYALNYEGRDLDDDEAYRHLIEKYKIDEKYFYDKLKSQAYKDKAYYEFALCKQLQVTGYPSLLIQLKENKFYLLANGYTDYDTICKRIEAILKENKV